MSWPLTVELLLLPTEDAVDSPRHREAWERWLLDFVVSHRITPGALEALATAYPSAVGAAFGVRLGWHATGRRILWQVRSQRVDDQARSPWLPQPDGVFQLPRRGDWPAGLGSVSLVPLAVDALAPAPARAIDPGVEDAGAVSWHAPRNPPVPGDLLLGDAGWSLVEVPPRIRAGRPMPSDLASHESDSASSLLAWRRQLDSLPKPSQPRVRLEVVEEDIERGWDEARIAAGLVGDFAIEGAAAQCKQLLADALDALALPRITELAERTAALRDRFGIFANTGLPLRVDAAFAVGAPGVTAFREELRDALRDVRDATAFISEAHRAAYSADQLHDLPELPGWLDDQNRYREPVAVDDWFLALDGLERRLNRRSGSDGMPLRSDVDEGVAMLVAQRIQNQNWLAAVSAWLTAATAIDLAGMRAKVDRRRAQHGSMCASAALAVVGARVPVRLVRGARFRLHEPAPAKDLKIVRSCSFGGTVDPTRKDAVTAVAERMFDELDQIDSDRVLLLVAVPNVNGRPSEIADCAPIGDNPNVLLVGGMAWQATLGPAGPQARAVRSPNQHGYSGTFEGSAFTLPRICATTDAGAMGGSVLFPSETGWRFGSGSSQSTPILAGACALLWSHRPSMTAPQLKALVLKHTRPLEGGSFHAPANVADLTGADGVHAGACRLDLAAALREVGATAALHATSTTTTGRRAIFRPRSNG